MTSRSSKRKVNSLTDASEVLLPKDPVDDMNVKKLRAELAAEKLDTGGLKKILVARLKQHRSASATRPNSPTPAAQVLPLTLAAATSALMAPPHA